MHKKCNSIGKQFTRQWELQTVSLLGIGYLVLFSYIPMLGIILAFKSYKISSGIGGIFSSKWVGLKYFQEFVTDYKFCELLRNTLVLSSLKLVLAFPVPILLAILISECKHKVFKRVIQTCSYMPNFISWILVSGIAAVLFSETSGVINQLLVKGGLTSKGIPFLTAPGYFWGMSVFLSIWKSSGWWAIIFLAAISGIDSTLYEAAKVDGAGRLQRIWYITLPGIRSSVVTVLILSIGSFLGGGMVGSNFEQSFLMGNAVNNATSEIIQTYAFKMGMSEGRFSYATAVDFIQSLVSITLVIISNRIAKHFNEEGLF
ncbi:MAG: ABC transporter permease subunit [Lachnospiraceae bacterium]|nr:ABC transporter permease subunit [Lachnospiraceae bacterium]